MGALDFLVGELDALRRAGLLREPDCGPLAPGEYLNASSNDYLGLAGRNVSRETMRRVGADPGAGASPLIYGQRRAHLELERALASWVNAEQTLIFTSGYAANVGTLGALAGPDDVVVSDALNHASIIDGCRLSRARTVVVPHCDLDAVRRALREGAAARRRWVVTESYFSMDGDGPDLAALRELCDREGAGLYVDGEVGAAGSTGRGEANLYNLASFLIVEQMRQGKHPKDAALEALRRIKANTVEKRLLNDRGEPNFNIIFYVIDKQGRHAGVSMYAPTKDVSFAVCDENGARLEPMDALLPGTN